MKIHVEKSIPMMYIIFNIKELCSILFRKNKVFVLNDEKIKDLQELIDTYERLKVNGCKTLRIKFSTK
jgi:hypothetical protein